MAAARVHGTPATGSAWLTAAAFWSLLSLLPDADVIGFAFGVRYEDEWGHRGATHSFAFSIALGIAVGLVAARWRFPIVRTAVIASLVLASHAVLDTMTTGGLGCALFWPFDLTRYFAPFTPIPVAPIGLHFFSLSGLIVSTIELLLFAPVLWFALRPAQDERVRAHRGWAIARVALAAVWLLIVWLLGSRDPVRERVVSLMVGDDTEFTPGFSEQLLDTAQAGELPADVRARLGVPFFELLFYEDGPSECVIVQVMEDTVVARNPPDVCEQRGIRLDLAKSEVLRVLGEPAETCWAYSRSPGARFYRARAVCFVNGRVSGVLRRWTRD
jgi:inner membrane protein